MIQIIFSLFKVKRPLIFVPVISHFALFSCSKENLFLKGNKCRKKNHFVEAYNLTQCVMTLLCQLCPISKGLVFISFFNHNLTLSYIPLCIMYNSKNCTAVQNTFHIKLVSCKKLLCSFRSVFQGNSSISTMIEMHINQ